MTGLVANTHMFTLALQERKLLQRDLNNKYMQSYCRGHCKLPLSDNKQITAFSCMFEAANKMCFWCFAAG